MPEPMPTPVWARPPFVLSALFVYLAVHFAVRMAMWHTLGIDDAEQALFAQEFAWGWRLRAPPLFTWMLLALGKAIGVNIVAISIVRYALLAFVFIFSYLTARRLITDPRLSALSVYSFAAIYVFAYYSHHDLTHTTALSAMLALGWYVFVRLAESPRLGWYLALGAVFGLGLLAKWNFVMFAAALPLACLVGPEYRRLVITLKIVPAVALSVAIVLPTILHLNLLGPTGGGAFSATLVGEQAPYLGRVATGLARLVKSALVYPEPLLPLMVPVFALPLWRGLRIPAVPETGPRPDIAFIGWTIAISLALHLVLVLAFGARELSERLMQPPLFILPVLLFMLVERGRPARLAVNAFAVILALLTAVALAARVGLYLRGADHCGSCRAMMPIEALADQLKEAGFSGSGTILTEGFHVGGNMRIAFPKARIIAVGYPPSVWPAPRGQGQCLIVWNIRDNPARDQGVRAFVSGYLPRALGVDPDAPQKEGVAAALMFGSGPREYKLGYSLYDGPVGDCR